ncbi:hypothetical protein M5K25_008355 [Dendrobium thyrsiflorum]|uniref:Uncharacterized protein n=1 Tax=Dendrobium thyrsiflorum TaxID=117978 RepID=A0ABD0VF99_DENTH
MVRRSARLSTPHSGEGADGRKAACNGKFWNVLEGMDSEACEHAPMDADVFPEEPDHSILYVYVACDSSLGSEHSGFVTDMVSCEPFSSGFIPLLDSSSSRQFLDLSLCEFKQAKEIAPP